MAKELRSIDRREFIRKGGVLGGVIAVAPLMTACDSGEEANQLTWLNWQDYIDPETIPQFEIDTGISVIYQTYESNDELERKLIQAGRPRRGGRSPQSFDLIVPSDNFIARFLRLELLDELDHDAITGLENLAPELRDPAFDPGNRHSIPWATGTTGIGYDSTVFTEPPSWDVFLNEEHAGRMTILEEIRDAFAAALFSLGKDPNTRSQPDIDAAAEQLIAMKQVIRGFDSSNYLDELANGELVAAHAYSSDLLQAKQRNPNLEFSLPQEGALRWVDSLAIPENAAHKSSAERFINFYLQPEISAQVAEFIQADTGNQAAREQLPQSVRTNPIIFPPEGALTNLVFTADLGEDEKLYEDAWARVQEAE
jgi:spermidine/putrescine transport system substrate-binding protein